MIVYCDTVGTFIHDCSGTDPVIGSILREKLKYNKISGGSNGEYNSWIHSLPVVAKILDKTNVNKDIYVGVEYKVVDTKQRVDFLIYGLDDENNENVVLIELKQWSSVSNSNLPDYVLTDGGHGVDDYWHPSYQAYNYANIMGYFNEYVYLNHVKLNACAFLHNMPEGYGCLLNDEKKFPLIHFAPAFLKDDQDKLAEFISKYVKKPYANTLYCIDSSRIRPSAEFANMVVEAIHGKPFFTLDEQQAYSVAEIISSVNEAIQHDERRTLIIKGGPGSGKSIVAINALGQLLNPNDGSPRKNACYVTETFTPRTYYSQVLADSFKKKAIKELFKTPSAFVKCSEEDFDCIIVDEAHRMLSWKYGWGVSPDVDCIDKLFKASRVNVFFIDEDQAVTVDDELSIDSIKKYAKKYGSQVIEKNQMILSSQFRCAGGEQYVAFVNHFLGYPDSGFVTLNGMHYELKVMDSIRDLACAMDQLRRKGKNARLMSGFTRKFASEKDPDKFDFIFQDDNVQLRWNKKKPGSCAILDKKQADRVFCIHTVQGLEVEYAGVIIGKDLGYSKETGKLTFNKKANVDPTSRIKNATNEMAEKLIRNTYKVLLTRGIRGTFIFAEDPELNEYLKHIIQ